MVSRQVKNLIDKTSSTPAGGLDSLRDLGLSFNIAGDMYVDDKIYNSVIQQTIGLRLHVNSRYRDAIEIRCVKQNLSLDASIELDNLVGSSGSITRQSKSAQDKVDEYAEQLLELEQKLLSLQQKYIKQFAAMESLVQRSKDTQTYLEGQFESMSNMYSSKLR